MIYSSVLSDEQLVHLARNGCPDAFNALAARYISMIRAIALSRRISGLEAEDLAQEGLIGLLRAVRSFDAGHFSSFRTYARICVDRCVISIIRGTLRKKQIPVPAVVSIQDAIAGHIESNSSGHDDPESVFLRRESFSAFVSTITGLLSPFEREVFFGFLRGETYGETASRLNTSPKAVDNALWRIRRKLRCNLSRYL